MGNSNELNVIENNLQSFKFSWKIRKFSLLKNEELYSPEFSIASLSSSIQWKIVVQFMSSGSVSSFGNGIQREKMRIGLFKIGSIPYNKNAVCLFKLCNSSGDIYRQESAEFSFFQKNKCWTDKILKPKPHVSVPGHEGGIFALKQNCLIIEGHISVFQLSNQRQELGTTLMLENTSQLQYDFRSLFQDQKFADVTLKVENDVVFAHKSVLCARSPVFRKMFTHDTKENRESTVEIQDITKSDLNAFLYFLYTGLVGDCEIDAIFGLCVAADRYEVETLQRTCSRILVSRMSVSIVTDILLLADMHSDKDLKDSAVEFICTNFSEVEATATWKKLLNDYPHLASYTLGQVSTRLKKIQL